MDELKTDKEKYFEIAHGNLDRLIDYLKNLREKNYGNIGVFLHLKLVHPDEKPSVQLHSSELDWGDYGYMLSRIHRSMESYDSDHVTINEFQKDGSYKRLKSPEKENLH